MSSVHFSLFFLASFLALSSPTHGKCLADQKSHLLQFKAGLRLNPMFSVKLANWTESIDCCEWNGVSCNNLGHVVILKLDHERSSVRNESWKAVFSLLYLEELSLAWNRFDGTMIPVELTRLMRLRHLNLSESRLIGQIPVGLSRMTHLVTLDVSHLYPLEPLRISELGGLVQNLTELREVYLDGVNISAQGRTWYDAVSGLRKLQVLSLRGCRLSGPVSPSLTNLTSLTTLQLDNNVISTTVPDFFTNFSNLRVLSLQSCSLHGKFPEKYFQIPTLEVLDVSFNELEGSMPQFLQHLPLKRMRLSGNNFSGSLPGSIGNLGELSELELGFCRFHGEIPITLTNLSSLVILDLTENNFSGSIPPLHRFRGLMLVDLSENAFTGNVPSEYFNSLHLSHVYLEHNSFSGRLPSSVFSVQSLVHLSLSHNNFDGEIEEFPNVSSSLLTDLELSHNNFSGSLRLDMFTRFKHLYDLDLSFNNLTIDVSCNDTFPQIGYLKLASCNIKVFPDFLKNQTVLRELDLSLNSITGEIPNWIWKVGSVNLSLNNFDSIQKPCNFTDRGLVMLDLHGNLLKGDIPMPPKGVSYLDYSDNDFRSYIPSNIGEYLSDKLRFFSLSNNSISGIIPESICNFTVSFITVLDLSDNLLEGRIPGCLFSVGQRGLKMLRLNGNKLSGIMPDTFLDNCGLHTLDLAGNALERRIPTSLSKCISLKVLNVGDNYLEDAFPCTLLATTLLDVLVLQSNRFRGEISCPWDMSHSWPSLQILDISYNNLSGTLPPQLFLHCTEMMVSSDINAVHLQLGIFSLTYNHKYMDNVRLTIKGTELELVKIPGRYKVLDFSSNNFRGSIPDAVGELKGLYILNISHNALTGAIPGSTGKLRNLGSLDLSRNQLTGMIPRELGDLTFLTVLNLSDNQLTGKIPGGRQMQTFPESSFLGNIGLCGFPLNLSCDDDVDRDGSALSKGDTNHRKEVDWFYVSAAVGFAAGLGIILLLNLCDAVWWRRFNGLIIRLLLRVFGAQLPERMYRNPIRPL